MSEQKKFGVKVCRERKCEDLQRDPEYPDSPQHCAVTHGMPGAMHCCVKEMDAEAFIRHISGQLNSSPYSAPRPGVRNCPKECPYKIFIDGEKFVFEKGKPVSSKVPAKIGKCALTGHTLGNWGACPCNVLGNPEQTKQIELLKQIIQERDTTRPGHTRLCSGIACPDGKDRNHHGTVGCPVIQMRFDDENLKACPLWWIPAKLLPAVPAAEKEPEKPTHIFHDPAGNITGMTTHSAKKPAAAAEPPAPEEKQKKKEKPGQQKFYSSSESTEHFTPRGLWSKALEVMGGIDCDPAANAICLLPAKTHYTKKHDGLHQPWNGRIWLNPPFGREVISWFRKLSLEIEEGRCAEAVVLWKAALETEATRTLIGIPIYQLSAIPRKRVSYLNGAEKKGGGEGSTFTTILHYFGPNSEKFIKSFRGIADIWQPIHSSNSEQLKLLSSEDLATGVRPEELPEPCQDCEVRGNCKTHDPKAGCTDKVVMEIRRKKPSKRPPGAGTGGGPQQFAQKCCGTCGHHKGRKTFHESCPRLGELLFKKGTKSAKILMEETQRESCEHWIEKSKKKEEPAP